MLTPRQRGILAGLVLIAVLTAGCNPLTLPFYLFTGLDPKSEPQCKLASEDKKKEVKVVILGYSGLETRPEFLRVDRELASMLSREMQQAFKENKEKVTLVSLSKVEKYKDEHPNWHALDLEEIGSHFQADFVIDLSIDSLTLYEAGGGNQLFHGHADISLTVVDVHKPGEDPVYKEEYTCDYPKRGPIPAADGSAQQFKLTFLQRVAKELSWRFTAHAVSDDIGRD